MKQKVPVLPRLVIVIAALIAIAAFFLPYISATDSYREYMETRADEKVYESASLTVRGMEDMSLFEYASVYAQAGKEIFRSADAGTFYAVLIGAIGVSALLILLAGAKGKPILTIFLDLVMGGAFWAINWDVTDRGIMPNSNHVWGIAYQLYYPLAVIIAISAIWLFVAKRKAKKAQRIAAQKEGNINKSIS